jgi:hypothetical protein
MREETSHLPPCPACGASLESYVAFIRGQYCFLIQCDECSFNQLSPRIA